MKDTDHKVHSPFTEPNPHAIEPGADTKRLNELFRLCAKVNREVAYGNFYLPETREGIDAALSQRPTTDATSSRDEQGAELLKLAHDIWNHLPFTDSQRYYIEVIRRRLQANAALSQRPTEGNLPSTKEGGEKQ